MRQNARARQRKQPRGLSKLDRLQFPGRGQRDTPIADVRGIVEIAMLLPGRRAARVRRQAAKLHVRYLGGDLSLVDEVCALRGLQEEFFTLRAVPPTRLSLIRA